MNKTMAALKTEIHSKQRENNAIQKILILLSSNVLVMMEDI